MAPKKSAGTAAKPKPRSRASRATPAAATARLEAAAREVVRDALPELQVALHAAADGSRETIAIPVAGRRTVLAAIKTRPNWYEISRRDIDAMARVVIERNWFAASVHELRCAVYNAGFRFASAETREWVEEGGYDFAEVASDMIHEWNVSHAIVAWWTKSGFDSGSLPYIEVPNCGLVDYAVVAGKKQISFTPKRVPKLAEDLKSTFGETMWEAIRKGRKVTISEDDEHIGFRVMKDGKSSDPLPVSPLVRIIDDLDFIEAVRVGDWNGAKARWEIIRQTKKGHDAKGSGGTASARGNAKKPELKAILKAMVELTGKKDLVTNWDQNIEWLVFDAQKHFDPALLVEVKQRLLLYGKVFAVLLLKTDSQITGLANFMMDQLRAEVLSFRERFTRFFTGIWESEEFKGTIGDHDMTPWWSVKPLYGGKALIEFVNLLGTNALAAPSHLREMLDLDDEEQSRLMIESHADPRKYTPPFEPRQGIAAYFAAPDDSGGNQNQHSEPGSPGRPEGS